LKQFSLCHARNTGGRRLRGSPGPISVPVRSIILIPVAAQTRMQQFGSVEISQEAFIAALKMGDE